MPVNTTRFEEYDTMSASASAAASYSPRGNDGSRMATKSKMMMMMDDNPLSSSSGGHSTTSSSWNSFNTFPRYVLYVQSNCKYSKQLVNQFVGKINSFSECKDTTIFIQDVSMLREIPEWLTSTPLLADTKMGLVYSAKSCKNYVERLCFQVCSEMRHNKDKDKNKNYSGRKNMYATKKPNATIHSPSKQNNKRPAFLQNHTMAKSSMLKNLSENMSIPKHAGKSTEVIKDRSQSNDDLQERLERMKKERERERKQCEQLSA